MTWRPTEAHWFEAYVPRGQTVYALEALANTGMVELDRDIVPESAVDTAELRGIVRAIERVQLRYAAVLPNVELSAQTELRAPPERAARDALSYVRGWCALLLRCRRRLSERRREQEALRLLQECLEALGDDAAGLRSVVQRSDFLYTRVLACPLREAEAAGAETAALTRIYRGGRHAFHVVADLPEHRAALEAEAVFRHCLPVEIPDWLIVDWDERRRKIALRQAQLGRDIAALEAEIEAHGTDPALRQALDDAAVLRWYLDKALTVTADQQHCHVTGWTSVPDPERLRDVLRRAKVDAVLMFRPPPPGRPVPVSFSRSWWSSPFRLFVDLAGTPGPAEIDPTPLLPFIVPLLFGYMFPDVGHGALLVLGGLALVRKYPAARFLIPCGLAAVAFGLLFGEFLGLPGVLPAVWVVPLDDPLTLLLVPMFFGALLVLLGLVFSGVEAAWRGGLRDWLRIEAAVLLFYVGALVGLVWPPALLGAAVAVTWYLWGCVTAAYGPMFSRVAEAIGRLLLSTLQLGLHTLSFLRVGAFALAHAAISHALLEIAGLAESPFLEVAVFAFGHLLVVLLEGLVVFVQTTRLVLFEFFIRFLRAEGRIFKPLTPPAPAAADRKGRKIIPNRPRVP